MRANYLDRIETAKTIEQIVAVRRFCSDGKTRITDALQRPTPAIRIIFAPTDSPNTRNVDELSALYKHYKFPTAYLFERCQGVTHSFGTRVNDSWFHFLCKNINLHRTPNGLYDIKPWGKAVTSSSQEAPSNGEDRSWMQAGIYLSWALQENNPHVVMMFFGNFPTVQNRLKVFLQDPRNADALMCDPFALYIPVLQELWALMDNTIWSLLTVFSAQEAVSSPSYPSTLLGRNTHLALRLGSIGVSWESIVRWLGCRISGGLPTSTQYGNAFNQSQGGYGCSAIDNGRHPGFP
jgi:hypothetical protein